MRQLRSIVMKGRTDMFKLGENQKLTVVKRVDFGVYLAESAQTADERILLPAKYVPANTAVGDTVEVFVYKDSSDRYIATTKEPTLKMGEVKLLLVKEISKIGAFLEWGLEKDLLLPFKEQTKTIEKGEEVLVSLYIDKSSRLCATMNVYKNLRTDSPYQKGDSITGRIYETSDNFGTFVAVDDIYSALISKQEEYGSLKVGEIIKARVSDVREDGKLNLSVREKAYLQISTDAEDILKLLDSYEGVLPFSDKAAPEVIRHETGMSKNEFKRACGHLLKEGYITIGEKAIRRIK